MDKKLYDELNKTFFKVEEGIKKDVISEFVSKFKYDKERSLFVIEEKHLKPFLPENEKKGKIDRDSIVLGIIIGSVFVSLFVLILCLLKIPIC